MIQEDYVSFELAKKLKEKGFPQEYNDYYYDSQGERYSYEFIDQFNFSELVAMPTLSLVAKWLREERDIWIYIDNEYDTDLDTTLWYSELRDMFGASNKIFSNNVNSYEEALTAGITKAIELIK